MIGNEKCSHMSSEETLPKVPVYVGPSGEEELGEFVRRRKELGQLEDKTNLLSFEIIDLETDFWKSAGYLEREVQMREEEREVLQIMKDSLDKGEVLTWEKARARWNKEKIGKEELPLSDMFMGKLFTRLMKGARNKGEAITKKVEETEIFSAAKGLFRRLVRKLHPDVAGKEAEERFKEMVADWEKAVENEEFGDFLIRYLCVSEIPETVRGLAADAIDKILDGVDKLEKNLRRELIKLESHRFFRFIGTGKEAWEKFVTNQREQYLEQLKEASMRNHKLYLELANRMGAEINPELFNVWRAVIDVDVMVRPDFFLMELGIDEDSLREAKRLIRPLPAGETFEVFFKDFFEWDKKPGFLAVYEGVRTNWGPTVDEHMPAISPEGLKYLGTQKLDIWDSKRFWDEETGWFRTEKNLHHLEPNINFPQVDWGGLNEGLLANFCPGNSFDIKNGSWKPLDPEKVEREGAYLGAYALANQNGWKFFIQRWDFLGLLEGNVGRERERGIVKELCGGPQLVVYVVSPEGEKIQWVKAVQEINILRDNLVGEKTESS